MSIIETLKLTPEEVEQIVAEYVRRAVRRQLNANEQAVAVNVKAPIKERILEFIEAQPGKQCLRFEISHKFKHAPYPQRLAAIEELLQTGKIRVKFIRAKNYRHAHIYYIPEQK